MTTYTIGKKLIFFKLMIVLFIGCNTPSFSAADKLSLQVYPFDLPIEVNGVKMQGMQVIPYAVKYRFSFPEKRKYYHLRMVTCHREIDLTKHKNNYIFEPVQGVEDSGYCPLSIYAYDHQETIHEGFFDLQESQYEIFDYEAKLSCNGTVTNPIGVGVCQSRKGLEQQIEFSEYMENLSLTNGCQKWATMDAKTFKIKMPKNKCLYLFRDATNDHIFRLTTYGYKELKIDK